MAISKSKFLDKLKWISMILVPFLFGIIVAIFSTGVKAGDWINRIETLEENDEIRKVEIKDLQSDKIAIRNSLIEISTNIKNEKDLAKERHEDLKKRFERIENRIDEQ